MGATQFVWTAGMPAVADLMGLWNQLSFSPLLDLQVRVEPEGCHMPVTNGTLTEVVLGGATPIAWTAGMPVACDLNGALEVPGWIQFSLRLCSPCRHLSRWRDVTWT